VRVADGLGPHHLPFGQVGAVIPPMQLPTQAYFAFRTHSGKEALLKSVHDWIEQHLDD
jgi:hypothetical protein